MARSTTRRSLSRSKFVAITVTVAAASTLATTIAVASFASGDSTPVQLEVAEASTLDPTTTVAPVTAEAPPVTEAPATTVVPTIELGDDAQILTAATTWSRQSSAACRCSVELPFAFTATRATVSTGESELLLSESTTSPLSTGVWSAPAAAETASAEDLSALMHYVGTPTGGVTQTTGPSGVLALDGRLENSALVRVFSLNGTDYVLLAATNDGSDVQPDFARLTASFRAS